MHLYRLDDDAAGALGDECGHGLDVVQVAGNEAGDEGCERILVLGLHRRRERAHRSTVEAVVEANNLVLVRVGFAEFASKFERALVGFGTRVCGVWATTERVCEGAHC
jgi:hypothetical protein